MPYVDPDSTDPLAWRGVALQVDPQQAQHASYDMATCFVQEYLRLGFTPERILLMFQTSTYTGPFMAYQSLGHQVIRSIIDQHMRLRGLLRRAQPAPPSSADDAGPAARDR